MSNIFFLSQTFPWVLLLGLRGTVKTSDYFAETLFNLFSAALMHGPPFGTATCFPSPQFLSVHTIKIHHLSLKPHQLTTYRLI